MSRFWRRFAVWFTVLLIFFAVANLAGAVRPMGLKPFRSVGFPLTVSAWGVGIEGFFDWSALAVDAAVTVVASGLVAAACAWARGRARS